MNKQRYGVRQKVTEGDLNQLQDYAEAGIEAVAADIVVGGGVVKGMEATPGGAFRVNIAAGTARDATGARASLPNGATLDLELYRPTEVDQMRWVTLIAERIWDPHDPRVDPNGTPYNFQNIERTQVLVVPGTAVDQFASPEWPDRASMGQGRVLIADVLVYGGTAAITAGDISTSRREVYTPVANLPAMQITVTPGAGAGYAAGTGQVQQALDDVGGRVQAHAAAADPHPQYAMDTDLADYLQRGASSVVEEVQAFYLPTDNRSWTPTAWDVNFPDKPTHIDVKSGSNVLAAIDITYDSNGNVTTYRVSSGGKTVTWNETWSGSKWTGETKTVV